MAFLLRPEGAQLHRLTAAQYERTGLAPDNATTLDGAQSIALKAGDWNKVKLSLIGDVVSVAVNESEVASTKLEPTNQRILSLFHYADASGVRVRHITYRGNWPNKIPGPSELLTVRKP